MDFLGNDFFISHRLSMVGLRPSSSLSTGCVVSLRGDWAIFRHAGSGRVSRVQSPREKSLGILRRGWELNPGHREDRQWGNVYRIDILWFSRRNYNDTYIGNRILNWIVCWYLVWINKSYVHEFNVKKTLRPLWSYPCKIKVIKWN